MHFGLLPRANRGIFAINELPDLAGKIQVGLFNILQEGDVQIKGYPVRLPLDVMIVFTANPEDYTARGKIITPLKDRIGAEIRTHYMTSRADAMAITAQEAWVDRGARHRGAAASCARWSRRWRSRRAAERQIDKRSGVSQRLPISVLETVVSNAERRALAAGESPVVARVTDIYAALPSMTGKFELEYEGELKGADQVARELVRAAVSTVFDGYFPNGDLKAVIALVRPGRHAQPVGHDRPRTPWSSRRAGPGPARSRSTARASRRTRRRRWLAAGIDFVLEGLYAQKTHQPQRRARLPRRGAGPPPAAGLVRATPYVTPGRRRGRAGPRRRAQEAEALQLTAAAGGGEGVMRYRYTKYAPNLLDDLDMDELMSKLSDLLLVERVRRRHAATRSTASIARCRRCTTRSSRRCSTAACCRRTCSSSCSATTADGQGQTRRSSSNSSSN